MFSFRDLVPPKAADGIGGTDQTCLRLDKLFQTARPRGLRGGERVFYVFVKLKLKIDIVKQERKRELFKFLWKFLTALIAALSAAAGVSACYTVNL